MCMMNVMNGFLKKTALAVTGLVFLATSATAAELPNFVPLVKKAGPAVVKNGDGVGQGAKAFVQGNRCKACASPSP